MEKIKSYFKDWTMFEKSWLLISSVTMVVLSLMWGDSMIALLSGLAGIISVVLCAKGKIENYAFGLFQAVTYAYICFQSHIYGEVMYNILMVPMIIIGTDTSTGERWRKRTHKELIENVELESDKFECKSRLNREDVVCWLKSIQ